MTTIIKRQIILDTETTGLEPERGHRIIEIGCIELINRRLTGNNFHVYLNPDRDIEFAAEQVHGLSSEFLKEKPRFVDVYESFIHYVNGAELVIHNAPFDVGFINHEFKLLEKGLGRIEDCCRILDTLQMARKLHPGQRNSLDALCKRYGVDNSNRELHGGLVDAELLALTYLAMTSGQESLLFTDTETQQSTAEKIAITNHNAAHNLRVIHATPEELTEHDTRLAAIEKTSGKNLWQ
jgi:DNA polymerase-3 subunit epsilon